YAWLFGLVLRGRAGPLCAAGPAAAQNLPCQLRTIAALQRASKINLFTRKPHTDRCTNKMAPSRSGAFPALLIKLNLILAPRDAMAMARIKTFTCLIPAKASPGIIPSELIPLAITKKRANHGICRETFACLSFFLRSALVRQRKKRPNIITLMSFANN